MNAPETVMSEYIEGFNAGYGYVLEQIERHPRMTTAEILIMPPVVGQVYFEPRTVLAQLQALADPQLLTPRRGFLCGGVPSLRQ